MSTMLNLENTIDSLGETIDKATKIIQALKEENRTQKEALDYVKQWLNDNVEGTTTDTVEVDSAKLLNNIKVMLGE